MRAEDLAMSLTKRLTKRGRCLVCRVEFDQPHTGRRRSYCSDAHRSQAHYWRTRPRDQAFQSIIREQVPTLAGCYVESIPNADAKWLILRYEWLGTMPRRAYSYGLKTASGALLGVAVFGFTMSPESRDVCGKDNRDKAICLERSMCTRCSTECGQLPNQQSRQARMSGARLPDLLCLRRPGGRRAGHGLPESQLAPDSRHSAG